VSGPGWPLLRYAAVGVLATALHWAAMAALVETTIAPAWLATGIGAALGAQIALAGNRWFTFGHSGPLLPAWWRFMGTAVVGAAFGMAVVAGAVAAGWHDLLAQALATGVILLLTYAVNRCWTFAG